MTTFLVTGCAGFIGSHIAERLLLDGKQVVGIDNFDPYYSVELKRRNIEILKKHSNFKFFEASILDDDALKKIQEIGIDAISHQAGQGGVRDSIKNPLKYINVNTVATARLLKKFPDVKKFVLASSSSVYGEVPKERLPVREDMTPRPIAPYGLSKLHAEQWCQMFSDVYGMKTSILRYFTVYGPRQRPDEAICKFTGKILRDEPIEIYGDGEQSRDFTFVDDIVSANLSAIEKGSGILNIGGGNSITVNRLVEILSDAIGKKPEIKHIGKQPGDVSDTLADITKAREKIGFEPATKIEDGVVKFVEWYKKVFNFS